MKTAISVEDSLMKQADEAARDLGLSRSGLISDALREYLRKRKQAMILERLNQAYANESGPEEKHLVWKFRKKLPLTSRW